MEYSEFKKVLQEYRDTNKDISDLYDIGVNILDGKYAIGESYYTLFKSLIESHYGELGFDWVEWFIFESKYGEDKTMNATDNGKRICYSTKSLWKFLEKNHKL
jgi:hypothetical protein